MIPGDHHIPAFFVPVEPLFQNISDHDHHNRLPSAFPSSAHHLHGVHPGGMMRRSMSFSGVEMSDQEVQNMEDEMWLEDAGGALGEKKKRLSMEQVKALEKSFELGNTVEPERKMQLARALGLQPRQVAIWFQNRRARWKTKQMEKDFEVLKRQLEMLKADNQVLRAQNKQFHSELMALQSRESIIGLGPINLNKENEASWSNASESSIDVNLGATAAATRSILESRLNDSNSSHHPISNKHVFPPSGSMEQHLLRGASAAGRIDHPTSSSSDGGLCNVFNSVEKQQQQQPGFWPCPDQHPNFR